MHNITLKVPEFVANHDDWLDDELLFMSFMHWSMDQNNINTQFYMYAQDVSIFLGCYNNCRGTWDNILSNIRRVFEVGRLNEFTVTFHYNHELLNHIQDIETIDVEITDPMVITRWSYLVGRIGKGKDIFEEHDNRLYYKQPHTAQSVWWKQQLIPFVHRD